jgi:hypothetical protein
MHSTRSIGRVPFPSTARTLLVLVFSAIAFGSALPAAAQPRRVRFWPDPAGARLYEPFDIGITVRNAVVANPFLEVAIEATFTPQGGSPIVMHGFCDSQDGTLFRVRFCPRAQVPHAVHITYRDPAGPVVYDGTFDVAWSDHRGFIQVDARMPHRFLEERTGDASFRAFIDRMAGLGFNKCRFVLAGGTRLPFNDREMNPFVGYDFTRFDLDYWRMIESRIAYMKDNGMEADVIFLIEWGTFIYRFIQRTSLTEAERRYVRYAVDRLGAFTNVTWNLGNEYYEYHSTATANQMGTFIKSYDPYGRIVTVHPSNDEFRHAADAWADTVCLQAYSGGTAITPRTQWNALRSSIGRYLPFGKPVVNDEYGYEGPYPPDIVRKSHWVNVFSGGYATYGSFESLSIRADDDRLFAAEVADAQLAHLLEFATSTPLHLMAPDGALVLSSAQPAFCRALRGHEIAVYLPDGGSVTVDLSHLRGASLPVEWRRPSTGERFAAGETAGASSFTGAPPFPGDALLHVGRTARAERAVFDFSSPGQRLAFQTGRGQWVSRRGAFGQPDATASLAWTWLRGHLHRDVAFDADLLIARGAGSRAGLVLRARHPGVRLGDADAIFVTIDDGGQVDVAEIVEGRSTALASGSATVWQAGAFNRVSVSVRGTEILVFVNGARAVGVRSRNPRPVEGHLGLFTASARVGFDNVRVRPIFFRDFDDGVFEGADVLSGAWRTADASLEQSDPAGGRVVLGRESYRRFHMSFSMRLPGAPAGAGGGVAVRMAQRDGALLRSGYFLHYDGARTVQFLKGRPGASPVVLASHVDPETGGVLRPGDWNDFVVRTTAARFTVNANGVEIFAASDFQNRWPTGFVQLCDLGTGARFDAVSVAAIE